MIIIGNGPSVRLNDLNKIANFPCLAANRFHLSYHDHNLRPLATFCIDPQVVDDHISDIQSSCMSPIYVPRQFAWRVFKKTGLKAAAIRYFPFDRGDKPLRFSTQFSHFTGNGASVVYTAIQYAAAQQLKDIYLYGIDHNFHIKKIDGDGMVIDQGEDNHFIKGYRIPAGKWFPPDMDRIENAFRLARHECEKLGINIWNATRGGALEIFNRIDFDNACEKITKSYQAS